MQLRYNNNYPLSVQQLFSNFLKFFLDTVARRSRGPRENLSWTQRSACKMMRSERIATRTTMPTESEKERMLSTVSTWLLKPQPRLGAMGLIALLVISSVITPLSLDMYTPAVPHMAENLATDATMVNMTLVGYYFFFALGMLVFGPLSDKFGRRPVLIFGIALYVIGSAACAAAPTIEVLIAARVVEALGAGAISAVCTAAVKDSFAVKQRERILSIIQVLFVVGPAAAPVIGAGVLAFADWRATFWILTAIGAACFILALLFSETLDEADRYSGGVAHTAGQLIVVGKNPGFMAFLLITSLFEVGFMGYIAVGSYIYVDFFAVGEAGYSMFFAVAAVVTAAGPLIWIVASKRISVRRFTTAMIALAAAMGIAVMAVGQTSPFVFCGLFIVFAIAESCTRPYSMNILLEQNARDVGSASALMNCIRTCIGSFGMVLAALPWPSYVFGVGFLMAGFMTVALIGWVALLRSRIPLVCVKDEAPIKPL